MTKIVNRGASFSLLLLLLLAILYVPTTTEDQDIWFHLRYGEHFVNNFTWNINHSLYSWTKTNGEWKYVSWIGSSLLYLIYKAGKFPGLYLFHWLVITSSALLFLRYERKKGGCGGIVPAAILMLAALAILPALSAIKAEVLSFLFFTSALYIYFDSKNSGQHRFYLYPPLFFLWGNSHGGFVPGLILLTLLLVGEVTEAIFKKESLKKNSLLLQFALFSFLSLAAASINPEGPAYIFEILGRRTGAEDYTSNLQNLFAYQSLWPLLWPGNYEPSFHKFVLSAWSMVIMFVIFLFQFIIKLRERSLIAIAPLFANLFFFWLAMKMSRASLYYPLLWLFTMTYYGLPAIEDYKRWLWRFLFGAGLANILMVTLFINDFNDWFGLRINQRLPVKEAEIIEKYKLPAPLLNDYLTGGYLMWRLYPEYKVFIDPRYGPYADKVAGDWFSVTNDLSPEALTRFRSKYPFKTAIIDTRWIYIIYWILSSPDWKLFYIGENAVIIVPRSLAIKETRDEALNRFAPERFSDIDDPVRLTRLFDLYLNMWPEAAKKILTYYRENISSLYLPKKSDIIKMEEAMNQKLQMNKRHIQ